MPLFWARLLFAAIGDIILQADATIVGWLVGTPRIGNAIQFADGSGYLWIAPACSSLVNVSLVVLCSVVISKTFNRPDSPRDIGWVGLASDAVIAINVLRVSLIGLYPNYFDLFHGPIGATLASWLSLALMLSICLFGARHHLSADANLRIESTFQPMFSAGLGLMLTASLLLKLPGLPHLTAPVTATAEFPGEVTTLLKSQGFQVTEVTPADNLAWVNGTAEDCKVSITEGMPQGWQQSLLEAIAAG